MPGYDFPNQMQILFTGEVVTQQSRSAAISNRSISRRHVRSTINEILVEINPFPKNWYCVFEMMMRSGRVCWADISTIEFWHFISFDSAYRCRHSHAHNWIADMANTLFVHDLSKYERVITHFITFSIRSCFHSIYFVFDVATDYRCQYRCRYCSRLHLFIQYSFPPFTLYYFCVFREDGKSW